MAFGMAGRSASEVVEAALERAALVEPHVRAFQWLDAARARRLARELDEGQGATGGSAARRTRAGVPVGIKDVIDTAGIPTEHGSAMFAGRVPDVSATVVRRLEAAGALVLGKTVTTECAFFHPGVTRNPWDTSRTSGGSSMGSAAGVAAGIVPAAVGTQTNGSVIRPAAFCGVVGFKPTGGRIPKDGVLQFSETLDQVGGFTRSVEDAALLAAAMAGEPVEAWWEPGMSESVSGGRAGSSESGGHPLAAAAQERPRFVAARTAEWGQAEPAMRERFEADVKALAAAGAEIVEEPLPGGLDEEAMAVHRTIMQFEGTQSLGALVEANPEKASETLRRYVEEGASIAESAYREALAGRRRLIEAFGPWAGQFDAILTPPTVGEAPTPETTGDPRFCTRWTLMAAPAITLPTGLGPSGLPLGLQLVGAPGADRRLLQAASWVESVLPAPVWSVARLQTAS